MLIVLILIGLICIILFTFLIITLSTLRIEVVDFRANNYNKEEKKIKNYIIYIRLYLFNKIKWISFKINKNKIKKIKNGAIIKWIDKKVNTHIEEFKNVIKLLFKQKEKVFSKQTIEYIKKLEIHLAEFKLDLDIGTTKAIVVSFATGFIASIMGIILANIIKDFDKERYQYKITPKYIDKNIFKIEFNCIINVKMVHIMNIIYVLLRKRSENRYGGTSNRRSYGYGNEQHSRYGRCKYNYR